MRTKREPCGCRSNDREWVSMCPTHEAEFAATHKRWNDERFGRVEVIDDARYPTPDEARQLPARNELERESGRRGGE